MPNQSKPSNKKPKSVSTRRLAAKRVARPAKPSVQPTPIIPVQPSPQTIKPAPASRHWILSALTWPLRWFWRVKWGLVFLVILAVSILMVPTESARQSTQEYRYDGNATALLAGIPKRDAALVLGAGVLPDGAPSEYLKHRVQTAVELYKAGRVGAIIMSGDNSKQHHGESTAMKAFAVTLGAKSEDVVVDQAGISTYDSCHRVKSELQITSVTVVTQGYHLPRAVLTCRQQGIDAIGVAARHNGRDWTVGYIVREQAATAKAFVRDIVKPGITASNTQ